MSELPGITGMDELPGCAHNWEIRSAQESQLPTGPFLAVRVHTIVLGVCMRCGEPETWTLPGLWSLDELRRDLSPAQHEELSKR